MTRRHFSVVLAAALPLLLAADGPPDHADAARAQMQAVEFMVGSWEGDGWIRMGPGEAQRFRSVETVQRGLDGLVLVIEGRHESTMKAQKGEVVHHAMAMLSYNAHTEGFDFHSITHRGLTGNFVGVVEDGAFIWSMEAPGGRSIRYTIRLDDEGRWVETGHMSPPGSDAWHEFFGITLHKAQPKRRKR